MHEGELLMVTGRDTATGPCVGVLPAVAPLAMNSEAVLADFTHYFLRMLGCHKIQARSPFVYEALVLTVRERVMERWTQSSLAIEQEDGRQVCYLSMEYLMGRLLRNALLSLGLTGPVTEAMEQLGLRLEDIYSSEHDAGLGNGGLGRLAACFLDSCATLKLPVMGYGIRYQYGMFHQRLENGHQVEDPDSWLREGYPWEIERHELTLRVKFGGRSESYLDSQGRQRFRWVETHDVLAVPFDIPIPGYRNDFVNTLRLWSAAATDEFDLEEFNAGSYTAAVASKNAAENITMVLYPNDSTENGQELRLRQQYFLASASLQDTVRRWRARHGNDFTEFAAKHCFQLNDTHPAVSVAELMRLLMDECRMEWGAAWEITRSTMAYTNHTLLPEALELWSVDMFRKLLPRLLDIIFEINARFIDEISRRWPGDNQRLARMSLVQEGREPMIRMAYLAIIGSFSVNGVAELHSRLLREGLFQDFAELWPGKFNNKTNGVTQRRWLAACNPGLSALISERIGEGWVTDLDQLARLAPLTEDGVFRQAWRECKTLNKRRLAKLILQRTGVELHTDMMFDVQVKRIHEYKRQLLNVLHAIHLYDRIKRGDGDELVPRAIIIGGKAAPGYVMAKNVIKFINNVARVINADPQTRDRLRLVFIPDYNVSAMEVICPAADLSEQISTAGKEASGTGNMKFMMNGAITIGTLDGANVEIREAVGEENFFLFGLTTDEVEAQRGTYDPQTYIGVDSDLSRVLGLIESGLFSRFEKGIFEPILAAVRAEGDPWMTAADFRSFVDTQQVVEQAFRDKDGWTRLSILNSAASGRFSTDRTMRDYNQQIWKVRPVGVSDA
jgi:starch phosphorylase